MNIRLLKKSGYVSRLILIFPGWSCDASLYSGLDLNGWDIGVVENYESPSFPLDSLNCYSTIYLFAWSLGVAFASTVDFRDRITAAYALNGTLHPVDDMLGIPCDIFMATAENLSPRNLSKFRRRMAGDRETFQRLFNKDFSADECASLKEILLSVASRKDVFPCYRLPWKRAYLSSDDAIFPFDNMKRSWENENVEIVELEAPHYLDMRKIIGHTIPDTEKVSERFSSSVKTYERRAVVQKRMARTLCDMTGLSGFSKCRNILEIGQGTGVLTNLYLPLINPEHIDFVDISDSYPEGIGFNHTFHKEDAEEWMERNDRHFDLIISSATLQWFVNLPRFIFNCASSLEKGGIFSFSTFLPGNLRELDDYRPTPLRYVSEKEIVDILHRYFPDVEHQSEYITVDFDSSADLLRHLKETGVAGSSPGNRSAALKLRKLKSLTFHCGYFLARKS